MDIKIKSEKISRLVWLIQIQQKICWDNFFEKNLLYGISYTKKHLRAFPFMSRLYRCTLYIWSYQKDVTKQKHTCGRITMYISTLLYHTLKGDDKMLVSLLSFAKKFLLILSIYFFYLLLHYSMSMRLSKYNHNVIFLLNLI